MEDREMKMHQPLNGFDRRRSGANDFTLPRGEGGGYPLPFNIERTITAD